MAASRGSLEWNPAPSLGQYTISAIDQLSKQMFSRNRPINPFRSTDESLGDIVSVLTLFAHTGIYILAIGSLIPAGLRIFCCYFFWCQPARLAC